MYWNMPVSTHITKWSTCFVNHIFLDDYVGFYNAIALG